MFVALEHIYAEHIEPTVRQSAPNKQETCLSPEMADETSDYKHFC